MGRAPRTQRPWNWLRDRFWMGFPCGKETNDRIKGTPAYKWLAENAKQHGFNPYAREGWHWEYNVGETY